MNEEVGPGDEVVVHRTCCENIPPGTVVVVESFGNGRLIARPGPIAGPDDCRRITQWERVASVNHLKPSDRVVVTIPGKSPFSEGGWGEVAEAFGDRVKVIDPFRTEGKNYWWFNARELRLAPVKGFGRYGYAVAVTDAGRVKKGDIFQLLLDRGGYWRIRLVSDLAPEREFRGMGVGNLEYEIYDYQMRPIPGDYRDFTENFGQRLGDARRDLEEAKRLLNLAADERGWTNDLREMVRKIVLNTPFIVRERRAKKVTLELLVRDFFEEDAPDGDIKTVVYNELKEAVHESEKLSDLRTAGTGMVIGDA